MSINIYSENEFPAIKNSTLQPINRSQWKLRCTKTLRAKCHHNWWIIMTNKRLVRIEHCMPPTLKSQSYAKKLIRMNFLFYNGNLHKVNWNFHYISFLQSPRSVNKWLQNDAQWNNIKKVGKGKWISCRFRDLSRHITYMNWIYNPTIYIHISYNNINKII